MARNYCILREFEQGDAADNIASRRFGPYRTFVRAINDWPNESVAPLGRGLLLGALVKIVRGSNGDFCEVWPALG